MNTDEKAQGPDDNEPEVPLPPDDEAPLEEEMDDVDATNSVATEHPHP